VSGRLARPFEERARRLWYGLVCAGGFAFGLLGDRRPFGTDMLAHPLVMFFAVVGVALLLLRVVLARPVPQVISERDLLLGCLAGAAAFLAANWLAATFMPVPARARF
jgi:hypothetical protein